MGPVNSKLHFQIVNMRPEDWPVVEAIYLQGIATGNATFETESLEWENWNAKHHAHSRLVARAGETVLGWGGAESGLDTPRVRGCGGGFNLYRRRGTREGRRKSIAEGLDRAFGTEWHLDTASRNLPRKHSQPRAAQIVRIPRGGSARKNRATQRRMERCNPARAPLQDLNLVSKQDTPACELKTANCF